MLVPGWGLGSPVRAAPGSTCMIVPVPGAVFAVAGGLLSIGAPAGNFSSVRPADESNSAERGRTSTSFTLPSGSASPSCRRTCLSPFLSCASRG